MAHDNHDNHDNHDKRGKDAEVGATNAAELLTVEQAAAYLQLSVSSIRSYIRQGRLRAFRVGGMRKILIPRNELLALLEPARAHNPG
jgi:excisionase family DNA binding protein